MQEFIFTNRSSGIKAGGQLKGGRKRGREHVGSANVVQLEPRLITECNPLTNSASLDSKTNNCIGYHFL